MSKLKPNPEKTTSGVSLRLLTDYSKTIPVTYRRPFLEAAKKACPPSKAIRAFCQQCVGYNDVRNAIHECSAVKCPLYAYRPYK